MKKKVCSFNKAALLLSHLCLLLAYTGCNVRIRASLASVQTRIVVSGPSSIGYNACTAYTVEVEKSEGSPISSASPILISLSGGGAGVFYTSSDCGTMATSASIPAGASSTIVYFSDLTAQRVTLSASSRGLTTGSSGVTILPGAPAKLVFTTEPAASGTAGTAFSSITTVEDAGNNTISAFSGSVSLSLYAESTCTTPASASVVSGAVAIASNGQANFTSVIDVAGTYYLGASGDAVKGCSSVIVIGASSPHQLIYQTAPLANAAISASYVTQPVVQVQDRFGNLVSTSFDTIAVGVYSNSSCVTSAPVPSLGSLNTTASSGSATIPTAFYFSQFATYYIGASDSSTAGITPACAAVTVGPMLATGNSSEHGCGLNASGNVYCWGFNNDGQIGNNTQGDDEDPTPVEVEGVNGLGNLTNVAVISAGNQSTCSVSSLSSGGNVYCWGDNASGELGNGTTTDSGVPVEVVGVGGTGFLSNMISVAANGLDACALSSLASGGNVYCWGNGQSGQLGDNSSQPFSTPVEVVGVGGSGVLSGIIAIASTGSNVCALSSLGSGGNVYCWGYGGDGELGNGNNFSTSPTPVEVVGVGGSGFLSGIVSISSSCAVSSSGSGGNVYCWGVNTYGQLGNNSTTGSLIPVEVVGVGGVGNLSGIAAVASLGGYETCALSSLGLGGNVYCWGDNSSGELGNNSTTGSLTPVEVVGVGGVGNLSGITSITTNGIDTCALSSLGSGGNVYCWGDGSSGQLGTNTTTGSKTPVEVLAVGGSGNLSGITFISTGGSDACAVSSAGNAYCWGYNNYGTLGDNPVGAQMTPAEVLGVGASGNLSGMTSVSVGEYHTCAASSSGSTYCWGSNSSGQLGDNSTILSKTPSQVLGVGGIGNLANIFSVSGGSLHTCAVSTLVSGGNVYCWGSNAWGQLGNNSTSDSHVPVEVLGVGGSGVLSNIVSVSAGDLQTCAVSASGNVYCWGYNGNGELGNNTTAESNTPVEVLGVGGVGVLSNMASVTAGGGHECGVSSSGNVYCWGDNGEGDLGNGLTSRSTTPVEVLGVGGSGTLSNIVSVSLGYYYTCAVSSSGSAYCWGDGTDGQLGDSFMSNSTTPVAVSGLTGITSVGVGLRSACALSASGSAFCWGQDNYGQLGNNDTTEIDTPVQVLGVGGTGNLSL